MRAEFMEFLGTFFLVLAIAMTGDPLTIALALTAMVFIGGHISGAHYNPAVTIAVWMRGKLPAGKILPYWVAQLLGAIAAVFAVFFITGNTFIAAPEAGIYLWKPILVEIFFTFLLAFVILTVATTKAFSKSKVYGFAIGLALFVGAMAGGAISGGAYNPAVGIGPMLAAMAMGKTLPWVNAIIYIVGPFIGAVLAAWAFKVLNPKE